MGSGDKDQGSRHDSNLKASRGPPRWTDTDWEAWLGNSSKVESVLAIFKLSDFDKELKTVAGNIPDPKIIFDLAPGDKLVRCPYNAQHLILEDRFLRHLEECSSQHEKNCAAAGIQRTIVVCHWNVKHHVHKLEIQHHEAACPHRDLTESIKPDDQESKSEPERLDLENSVYDPKDNDFLLATAPAGSSESEKKAFRAEQARRYNIELEEGRDP